MHFLTYYVKKCTYNIDTVIICGIMGWKKGKGDHVMLIQFSVENFRSYKDRAVLSMEASSDKELSSNVVDDGKNRIHANGCL